MAESYTISYSYFWRLVSYLAEFDVEYKNHSRSCLSYVCDFCNKERLTLHSKEISLHFMSYITFMSNQGFPSANPDTKHLQRSYQIRGGKIRSQIPS